MNKKEKCVHISSLHSSGIGSDWGTKVMKKGQKDKRTHRKAGIRWNSLSGGDDTEVEHVCDAHLSKEAGLLVVESRSHI